MPSDADTHFSSPAYRIVSRQTTTSSHGVEWLLTLESVGHARPAVVVEVEQEFWAKVRVGDCVVMTPHVVRRGVGSC